MKATATAKPKPAPEPDPHGNQRDPITGIVPDNTEAVSDYFRLMYQQWTNFKAGFMHVAESVKAPTGTQFDRAKARTPSPRS